MEGLTIGPLVGSFSSASEQLCAPRGVCEHASYTEPNLRLVRVSGLTRIGKMSVLSFCNADLVQNMTDSIKGDARNVRYVI